MMLSAHGVVRKSGAGARPGLNTNGLFGYRAVAVLARYFALNIIA